ncbi:AIG2-like family protein [compost metagenome]
MLGYSQTWVEITDPQVLATSGKTHHPIVTPSSNADDRVAGMVFQISEAELAAADAYEVSDYKRVAVTLASGLTAWVYVRA